MLAYRLRRRPHIEVVLGKCSLVTGNTTWYNQGIPWYNVLSICESEAFAR